MSGAAQSAGNGISFGTMLGLLFIGLKLTGYIAWSWWWVLCPFWAPIAVFVAFLAVLAVAVGGVSIYEAIRDR